MKLELPHNQASKAWRLSFLVYHAHHIVMIIFSHHSQIPTALPVCCSACSFAFSGVSSDFKPSSISTDTAEQPPWAVHPLPKTALFHACIWVPLGLTESPVYPACHVCLPRCQNLFDFTMFHMGSFPTVSQFPCLEDHMIARKWHDLQDSGLLECGKLTPCDVYT